MDVGGAIVTCVVKAAGNALGWWYDAMERLVRQACGDLVDMVIHRKSASRFEMKGEDDKMYIFGTIDDISEALDGGDPDEELRDYRRLAKRREEKRRGSLCRQIGRCASRCLSCMGSDYARALLDKVNAAFVKYGKCVQPETLSGERGQHNSRAAQFAAPAPH
eukprot:6647689-Prymnesium_polylepis.2